MSEERSQAVQEKTNGRSVHLAAQRQKALRTLIEEMGRLTPGYWPIDDTFNDDFVIDFERGLLAEPDIEEDVSVMSLILSGEEVDPTGGDELPPEAYAEPSTTSCASSPTA